MALTKEQEERLAELERKSSQTLSPEQEERLAYLESKETDELKTPEPATLSPKTSKSFSAISGLGQGSTFGFGDELAAAVGVPLDVLFDAVTGGQPKPIAERYRDIRDFARDLNTDAKESHPWIYGGSELAGGIASAAPLSGGAAFASKLPNLLKAGTTGQAALTGGALGGAYGLGASQADLTKGEFGDALSDTALGVGFGAATAGLSKYGLDKVGKALRKTPTTNVENKIAKQVQTLTKTQAKPESEILTKLSSSPGTKEGMAIRERALMSPLTREAKIKGFIDSTRSLSNKIDDAKVKFDSGIRIEEAKQNLAKVPADETRQHINKLTVKIGELSDEVADNPDLYDSAVGKKVNRILNQMRDDLYNPEKKQSSFDMYKSLNEAKKKIQSYGQYDKSRIGPVEKDTIDLVRKMEGLATEALENPKIFGDQAFRHAEINDAYTRYITSMDNLEKGMLQQEYVPHGRPKEMFSSTKVGTYAKQLDTAQGSDRIRLFNDFLDSSENLFNVVEKSPVKNNPIQVASEISGFKKGVRDPFVDEMTLSNQLRRLRWDQGVQNAADGIGGGPIPGMAIRAGASATRIPGAKLLADVLTKNTDETAKAQALLQELLNKERQMQAGENFVRGAVRPVKQAVGSGLEKLGNLSPYEGLRRVQKHFQGQIQREIEDDVLRQSTGLISIQGGVIQDEQERAQFADEVQKSTDLDEQEKMRIGLTARHTGKIIRPRDLLSE